MKLDTLDQRDTKPAEFQTTAWDRFTMSPVGEAIAFPLALVYFGYLAITGKPKIEKPKKRD